MRTKRSSAGCWYSRWKHIDDWLLSTHTEKRSVYINSVIIQSFQDYSIFSMLFFLTLWLNDIRIPNKISNQIKPIKLKIQLYNPSSRIKNFFKKKNGTILLRLILKICFFSWNESFTIECSPTDEGRKHGVIEQMIKPIKIFPIVVYTSWLYDFSGRYTSWLVPTCVRREGEGAGVFEKGGIIPLMRGRAEGKSWIVGCARHALVILAWFTWSAVAYLTPFSKVISIDYLEIDALVPRALCCYLASTLLLPLSTSL